MSEIDKAVKAAAKIGTILEFTSKLDEEGLYIATGNGDDIGNEAVKRLVFAHFDISLEKYTAEVKKRVEELF